MSFYPNIDELQLRTGSNNPEAVLLEVRRSFRSILSNMFYFGLSVVVVVIINIISVRGMIPFSIPILENISVRWLSIVPVVLLLNIVRNYYDDLYQFKLHKIVEFGGRLSLSYTTPAVVYQDIRAVNVRQDILGRIFDYGDVQVGTPGHDGYEMTMQGIRAPRELAVLIDRLRDNSMTTSSAQNRRAARQDEGSSDSEAEQSPEI